jgi:glycosyltransferase EpsD
MLIEAMEKLVEKHPNIHLLLPGIDSMNGFHEKLAKEKGLTKNIRFLDYRNDIPHLLQISNISVSTSRREGLPVNIMEAMYVGLPVVATDCRGNGGLVADQQSGFIVRHKPEEMGVKVALLAASPELQKSMGLQGKRIINNDYLMEKVITNMKMIYRGQYG